MGCVPEPVCAHAGPRLAWRSLLRAVGVRGLGRSGSLADVSPLWSGPSEGAACVPRGREVRGVLREPTSFCDSPEGTLKLV